MIYYLGSFYFELFLECGIIIEMIQSIKRIQPQNTLRIKEGVPYEKNSISHTIPSLTAKQL